MRRSINLYISLYPISDKTRSDEIKLCLKKNLLDKNIDNIYVYDEGFDFDDISSPKLIILKANRRPTYSDFFNILNDGCVNIIANNDIYFDKSIKWSRPLCGRKDALCLSRYEENGDIAGKIYGDSQDTWILPCKPNSKLIARTGFNFGVPGCDNKLAFELASDGYIVTNPAYLIKTFHLHASQVRSYTIKDRLLGPYLGVPPVGVFGYILSKLLQGLLFKKLRYLLISCP